MAGIGHRGFMGRNKNAFCPYLPGLYSESEIDDLVFIDGYIPVYDASELEKIRTGVSEIMGGCTKWGGNYTTGLDKKYIQVSQIDASSLVGFDGIASYSNNDIFTGIFDGNELILNGVSMNISTGVSRFLGLFSRLDSAQIINIRLNDINVIYNGSGTNQKEMGCLFGQSLGSNIQNCILVNSSFEFLFPSNGGYFSCFGGTSDSSTIDQCGVINGNITAKDRTIGVFIGGNLESNSITNCFVSNSTINSDSSQNAANAGLFVGNNNGQISQCYAYGDVVFAPTTATFRRIGGFCGINSGTSAIIENCYALVDVQGAGNSVGVGGFCGRNERQIINSYSVGLVTRPTGSNPLGGFIGSSTFNVVSCHWDTDVSALSTSSGGAGARGRTTIQMQQATEDSYILPAGGIDGSSNPANLMYENWNPAIWDFGTSSEYPKLINTP